MLEVAVREARDVAEAGARAVLDYLGVAQATPPVYLNDSQQTLSRRLKHHGTQLGDSLNGGETQTMERLVEETAYEHWHRMLFARILSENGMLMYPSGSGPVPVTLVDCADLAAEEGVVDGWECAARYAARMLPQIFRVGSPVFDVVFPPEHRQGLEKVIASLPPEIYVASDTLGWIYQFWQSKRKDDVNASEVKIGARELPAVTQLFTEKFMVDFLLDNSLGAWWAARRLSESGLGDAGSEDELRRKSGLPGVPLNYLRFVHDEDAPFTPAAGTFERWPDRLADFRMLDPCCGSGHFLVAAFNMLVPMRMEAEGLSAREAVDAVLHDNVYGLELDRRCVEIAAFALAMAAWTYPGAEGYRELPKLNLACSGTAVGAEKGAWTALADGNIGLESALGRLYDSFKDASVLGSLIDPEANAYGKGLYGANWDDVKPLLDRALAAETTDERMETAVTAKGIAEAAELLNLRYTLIVTNVPYLKRSKQVDRLRRHCEAVYPASKSDIATVFMERCLNFCAQYGTISLVMPQSWLNLVNYKNLRKTILANVNIKIISLLGDNAFQTPMWSFYIQLIIISQKQEIEFASCSSDCPNGNVINCVDVSGARSPSEKDRLLISTDIKTADQNKQLLNPDARVMFTEFVDGDNLPLLSIYADCLVGIQTGDDPMFILSFWELPGLNRSIWELLQVTPEDQVEFAGMSRIIRWVGGEGLLFSVPYAYPTKGLKAVGKMGIVINRMGGIFPCRYSGERFHQNVAVILLDDPSLVPALYCYCSSPEYQSAVKVIDQKLKVTNATLVKVPFDKDRWTNAAKERYPKGLPAPYSDDPTQWIFHGHPCGSVKWDVDTKHVINSPLRTDSTVLQVAVARLLGYRWPSELDEDMEIAAEQREWVRRCDGFSKFVDKDGIVAIPAVKGEGNAKDRLLNILAFAYGKAWSNDVMSRLLASSDHAGGDLESWLRDKFFAQHCRLFQNRPFIWQIWDGLRDGFSALVNCHKLDRRLLESLTYAYLGDWIRRQTFALKGNQEDGKASGVKSGGSEDDGALTRLTAALELQKRLEAILEGEAPYDIFVRWKPLKEQPIGWNPDINDGVRPNIRPFMMPPDIGRKGAGLLRDKPNLHWAKDRGKDIESAPWYHLDKGDRVNDRHLKRAEKEKARS
jgi:hypothetical protein